MRTRTIGWAGEAAILRDQDLDHLPRPATVTDGEVKAITEVIKAAEALGANAFHQMDGCLAESQSTWFGERPT